MLYPKFPATYWSFKYALDFIGKKASLPPLGLMTVAALLPKEYDVKLIDLNVAPVEEQDILNADFVFISAMIIQKESFSELVALCNALGTPVVAGGPYPISFHGDIEGVSHFVLDEAEVTLPEFLRDLENGSPKKVYTANGVKPDLKTVPPPRFDIIDVQAYNNMSLQYSRGCPFNCEFCDIIEMFGRVSRTKTPDQFARELDAVYEAGFRGSIFIVDDNFIGNKKEVKALLRRIILWQEQHGFPFTFFTEASINLAQDDELLELMVGSGFTMVFIGIETPDEATLAFTQKNQNLKGSIFESIAKIQGYGIEVTGGFIVGFDTDKEDIFDRQISFIQKAGIPVAMVGMLTAVPKTQLYRRLERENRLLADSSGNNTHDFKVNFLSKMPVDKLVEGYKRMIAEVFSPKLYFNRCITLLKRKPIVSRPQQKITKAEIKAFFLSLRKQTFSRYGFYYLYFLLRTLFQRPGSIAEAITFAIKGYHLFTITRQILLKERGTALA